MTVLCDWWLGPSVGEELWGREQTGAWEEDPVGQEAGIATKAGSCVVSEPQGSMEDQTARKGFWCSQVFIRYPTFILWFTYEGEWETQIWGTFMHG